MAPHADALNQALEMTFGPRMSARLLAIALSAALSGLALCILATDQPWMRLLGAALLVFGVWRVSYRFVGRTVFKLDTDGTVEWRVGGLGRKIPLSAIVAVRSYGAALDLDWNYGLLIEWVDGYGATRETILPDAFEATPGELATLLSREGRF